MSSVPAPAPRLPRWAKVVLVLSLALNLAVAGVVAGHFLRDGPGARERAINLPIDGFRNISRAMPPDDRAALHKDWNAQRAEIRAARRALRRNRAAFLDALRADPFSQQALEAILTAQATQWQDFGTKSREILIGRISEMSPEARIAFADNLEAALNRRRSGAPAPRTE